MPWHATLLVRRRFQNMGSRVRAVTAAWQTDMERRHDYTFDYTPILLDHSRRCKRNNRLDISIMQSLVRYDDLPSFLVGYGQIIVDECHHVSAISFESILKKAPCRWVFGLTATPIRRDGLDPIVFLQCGPISHAVDKPHDQPGIMEVKARVYHGFSAPTDVSIQGVFSLLVSDEKRNSLITQDEKQHGTKDEKHSSSPSGAIIWIDWLR
jgi:superfamily II DNA or RNA helicase